MATPLIYNVRGQRMLTMDARHIRALTDGGVFLTHLSHLQHLDLEPYCIPCACLGQMSNVIVTLEDLHAEFCCRHTAGRIRRDKPLEVEPLLKTLKWGLRCTACGQPVTADNGKTDSTFRVDCSCTARTMANPLAPSSQLPQVGRLGGSQPV